MTPVPPLRDGRYPFGQDYYPRAELAMSEAPPELAALLIARARAQGVRLIRDEIVELVCKGDEMPEMRFMVYWPQGAAMHVLVPKNHVVGRA